MNSKIRPSFMQPDRATLRSNRNPQTTKLMKQTKLIKVSLTCLALAVLCGVAQAQPTNLLGNPGFEQPDNGKITNFFGVPYWSNDGVNYVNTGVENTGSHSGNYRAFEMDTDDGAYQISTNTVPLGLGDQVILTWWALGTTSSDAQGNNPTDPMQIVGIITATNSQGNPPYLNDPFINTTAVLVTSNGLPNVWSQYSLTYYAQAADVGKYPGVFFNTGEVGPNTTNVWAGYDDFALYVVPANSLPIIITSPASQTSPIGGNLAFTVLAIDATGYQWMGGTPGSGVYTNLSDGTNVVGGITNVVFGATTTNLTITGVTTNDNMDIVVVVSNGSGSVTSAPPANLTVAAIIYLENFNMPTIPNQMVTNVGWVNDVSGSDDRIFTGNGGLSYPNMAVYSWVTAAANEAFYATVVTANGGPYDNGTVIGHMAFPGINLAVAQNVSFNVDLNTANNGAATRSYIAVQMNSANWYMSTNELLPRPSNTTFVPHSMSFKPSAGVWKQLTVSGSGTDNSVYPIIGPAATNNLAGYITGVGIVCVHTANSTMQFDNFAVLGAIPPTTLPVINAPPASVTNFTGTTATFSVAATTNGSTAGLTYQWRAGTVGSGVYANLSNGGQFSGVTNNQLRIANVTSNANHKDYVVVVTDGAGSVTSAPPATLTVLDGPPVLTVDAAIYPDAAPDFDTTNMSIHAGNNNTLHLTATFVGSQPISYQWKISPNPDGSGAVNVLGATNTLMTLANPQTNASGYYSLQATNSKSVIPTNSSWVQLTVLPASTAQIRWAAPVAINGLTAAQILGLPGTNVGAESFGAGSIVMVTNGATIFSFDNTGLAAVLSGTSGNFGGVYTGPSTGDSNLDAVLNVDVENGGGPTLTLNNLTVSNLYTAQLIALNDVAGVSRVANWSDPNDAADVSPTFAMGDNVYVLGTFMATNTTQDIKFNEAAGGYVSAVVIRHLAGPASPTIQKSGSNLQVSWSTGTLLQATNLTGPWIPNNATSPLTISPASPRLFFRTQFP